MRRLIVFLLGIIAAFSAGAIWVLLRDTRPPTVPDAAAVLTRVRDVTRLETLEVNLYKKITFAPEPSAASPTLVGDVLNWAKFTMRSAEGKAIVFATVRLGFELSELKGDALSIDGTRVHLKLPPLKAVVELKPGETEMIGSNLDSAETAQLLEEARRAFERDVSNDAALRARARTSAERALRGLLFELGFREVVFTPVPTG